MKYRILIVDDEASIRMMLAEGLKDFGYETHTAQNSEEASRINAEMVPAVILLDLRLGQEKGLDLIDPLLESNPSVQIVVLTAYGDVHSAVTAMKKGVYDFLNKPFDLDELEVTIKKALAIKTMKNKLYLQEKEREFNHSDFVGDSKTMQRLVGQLQRVARMDGVTVLIRGESGTGKELAATHLYRNSPRSEGPYIKINCAAMPENLVESELFGYTKGAFTGATMDKVGLFEAADGGTIFLDEVGELSPGIQAKLLRVLEERKVQRLGSLKEIPIDVRVLAATNKDLEKAIEEGHFREDLYYRLNVFPVMMPPLREHLEDLDDLVDHFVTQYGGQFGKEITVDPTFIAAAKHYDWPGNIRELRNMLERLSILNDDEVLTGADLGTFMDRPATDQHADFEKPLDFPLDLNEAIEELEKELITRALEASGNNVSQAAEKLSVTRFTLMRRMDKYNL